GFLEVEREPLRLALDDVDQDDLAEALLEQAHRGRLAYESAAHDGDLHGEAISLGRERSGYRTPVRASRRWRRRRRRCRRPADRRPALARADGTDVPAASTPRRGAL